MYDLIYFGYELESPKIEQEFIVEIKERFPDVVLKDAYDYIKGHRQEVQLAREEEKENYYAWLIAYQWLEFSLTGQLFMLNTDKEEREKLKGFIDLAKTQYPQKFK